MCILHDTLLKPKFSFGSLQFVTNSQQNIWLSFQLETVAWSSDSFESLINSEKFLTENQTMDKSDTKEKTDQENFNESVEMWNAEKPQYEKVEPSNWPPLIKPGEVKTFQPEICVQG